MVMLPRQEYLISQFTAPFPALRSAHVRFDRRVDFVARLFAVVERNGQFRFHLGFRELGQLWVRQFRLG